MCIFIILTPNLKPALALINNFFLINRYHRFLMFRFSKPRLQVSNVENEMTLTLTLAQMHLADKFNFGKFLKITFLV